jgi:hypothetical protein
MAVQPLQQNYDFCVSMRRSRGHENWQHLPSTAFSTLPRQTIR